MSPSTCNCLLMSKANKVELTIYILNNSGENAFAKTSINLLQSYKKLARIWQKTLEKCEKLIAKNTFFFALFPLNSLQSLVYILPSMPVTRKWTYNLASLISVNYKQVGDYHVSLMSFVINVIKDLSLWGGRFQATIKKYLYINISLLWGFSRFVFS